jgi:hypothetical protein
MMASVIFVVSLVCLLQFFVSYCRSVIAASAKQPLSQEVQDVTGLKNSASREDFARVTQLLHLCPERPEDRNRVHAIGAYFSLLGVLRATVARFIPSLREWTSLEQGQCAYFVAVALDRRIAFSRELLAQQMDA